MKTLLFPDDAEVARKGVPDPPGSRYCLADYANDEHAFAAAESFAIRMRDRDPTFAKALLEALSGGDEATVLRTYEIEPLIEIAPDARFVVLNFSRIWEARNALVVYRARIRHQHPEVSARIIKHLDDSDVDFAAYMRERYRTTKKATKRTRKGAIA